MGVRRVTLLRVADRWIGRIGKYLGDGGIWKGLTTGGVRRVLTESKVVEVVVVECKSQEVLEEDLSII
jgi:hypothetical protein